MSTIDDINNIEQREKLLEQERQMIELLAKKIALQKQSLELMREQNKFYNINNNYLPLLNGGLPNPFLTFPSNHNQISSEPYYETELQVNSLNEVMVPPHNYERIDDITLMAANTRGITSTLNVTNEFYALNTNHDFQNLA